MSIRQEIILVAIGLVVLAGLILYDALQLPDTAVLTEPQTVQQTTDAYDAVTRSRYAVNINEANFTELMGVRGMTETIAKGILTYRAETGRFYSTEELLRVPGVGEKTLEKLLPYIVLDDNP